MTDEAPTAAEVEALIARPCPHDLAERETACADGYCPLCTAADLAAQAQRIAELERDGCCPNCGRHMPAVSALRALNEETVLAGYPGGDRDQTLANVRAMRAALRQAAIVGWMVGDDPQHAAMYNAGEQEKAHEAAKRWNRPITALVLHPEAPTLDAAPAAAPREELNPPLPRDALPSDGKTHNAGEP